MVHSQSMIIGSMSDFSFQQTNDYTPLSSTAAAVNVISQWEEKEGEERGEGFLNRGLIDLSHMGE